MNYWRVTRERGKWFVVSFGYLPPSPGCVGRGEFIATPYDTRQQAREEAWRRNEGRAQ